MEAGVGFYGGGGGRKRVLTSKLATMIPALQSIAPHLGGFGFWRFLLTGMPVVLLSALSNFREHRFQCFFAPIDDRAFVAVTALSPIVQDKAHATVVLELVEVPVNEAPIQ
jgi:hypothetical protein